MLGKLWRSLGDNLNEVGTGNFGLGGPQGVDANVAHDPLEDEDSQCLDNE